jgi:hypothetical protein
MSPKVNLGEKLETHLAGKATKKRQNFDPSTPPAYRASPLQIERRNQEGPWAAITGTQADKVS